MPEFAHVCMCAQGSRGGRHSNRAIGLFSLQEIVVVCFSPPFSAGRRNFPLAQHKHMLTFTFSSCLCRDTDLRKNAIIFTVFDLFLCRKKF